VYIYERQRNQVNVGLKYIARDQESARYENRKYSKAAVKYMGMKDAVIHKMYCEML